jgi:hypothetical protein
VCVNPYTLFYGHLARVPAGMRIPVIEIFHSSELALGEDTKTRLIYRHFFNISDRIIYVSQTQRTKWESRGIRQDYRVCIHNGIDFDYFNDQYSPEEKYSDTADLDALPTDFVVGICACEGRMNAC